MRILAANYRYFVSSGPERYLFNLTHQLEGMGHQVLPFSIRYSQNRPSPYEGYFASPIGTEDEVYFADHRHTIRATSKGLSRLFYSREVERAVGNMVDDTQPDVAYVLYYLRKMSPSLLVGIKKRRVPIVVRISDFGMMCGEHHMLRDDRPCTDCLTNNRFSQVRHRCVKGSTALSAIDAMATAFHHARGYFDLVDHFVTTNDFMTTMMVSGGIPRDRIVCIPTFTDTSTFCPAADVADPAYLLYAGRIDRPKGVHVMIEAMRIVRDALGDQTPLLRIAGAGHDKTYVSAIKHDIARWNLGQHITLLGSVPTNEMAPLYRDAYACLTPTLWFENLPNSVIEAFASGCPVVASDIGSMSTTVTDGHDGLSVRPDDPADLADAIVRLVKDPSLRDVLAKGAIATAHDRHAPESHTTRLIDLFKNLTPAH